MYRNFHFMELKNQIEYVLLNNVFINARVIHKRCYFQLQNLLLHYVVHKIIQPSFNNNSRID